MFQKDTGPRLAVSNMAVSDEVSASHGRLWRYVCEYVHLMINYAPCCKRVYEPKQT